MSIDINDFAVDQRAVITAFREAGSKSFQDAPDVTTARANYEKSCAANGLPADEIALVEDVTVAYDEGEFKVRVYDPRPATATADPVLVFFHGGGWVVGSLDTHDTVCRRLATLTRLPVVAVDYRLGPDTLFPAGHLDCREAVRWIRDNSQERAWDASRLVTVGDSAGGGLATVTAFLPEMRVAGTTVVAQVPLYPMLDQTDANDNWARVSTGVPLTKATLEWFLDNYVPTELRGDYRVSPLLLARQAARGEADAAMLKQPPALILTLGHDPLAAEGLEYAGLLALGGTHVELVHIPDLAHGIFTSAAKVASGERFLERVAEFVLRQLGK